MASHPLILGPEAFDFLHIAATRQLEPSNWGVTADGPPPSLISGMIMLDVILANFSLSTWFFDAWAELVRYFNTMNTTQWGVVSACAVAFGFLCLKGNGINR